ncbi:MAG: T9SS type A sorting domain-containing protein, partial [Flavobacteriales bacterium]|nr:T9SS type A sorting domain-containing protein [Flavobacteriales bacterium]
NGTDDDCDGNTDDVGMNTYYADIDGDGYGDASNTTMDCTQPTGYVTDDGDCDDGDANVNPGMDEICNNGVDDNCDGNTDDIPVATYYNDNDGDGYGDPLDAITACQQPDGYVTDNTDCDDNNEFVNPGAEDLCNNGSDDNCDGTIDETPVLEFYADTDGDGYGDPLMSLYDCTPPLGYVSNNEDCDDTNFDINPAATEVCNDMDDDCNESIDDGVTFTTYYADSDGDGYGDANTSISSCEPVAGYVTDNTDCDDNDNSSYPGGTEICDNVDNDCDGDADNGLEFITYFADEDGDGYGSAILGDFCSAPANSSVVGGDCNDNNASISPDASESCDEIDNNCDGNIDNDVVYVDYYDDNDGDGFGDLFLGNLCIAPIGGVTTPGDCDDSNEEINPDATEICNDTDDNCDELVDEGLEYADYYSDDDGDGYGDVLVGSFCAAPLNTSTTAGDCDDNNANINPGSVEFCNEVDDNCDEAIDNDVSYFDYYSDLDGDGYGADYLGNFCLPPADAVINSTDCDDTDAGVHPNAPEFCDNADNNCNGSIDEGLITFTYYADNDGDAVGGDLLGDFCSPPANSSLISGDCNDSDENVYPGADEVCNSEDDNCNEAVDEGVLNSYYEDADGDNYGDIGGLVLACSNPTGYVDNSDDCDDSDSSINPDAIEFCDGIDNDCNGAIDDNCIDSVEEINISWSVQLYPNPAHDQLNVVVSGATGMMDYTIHDAMGRLVIQSKLNGSHVVNLIDCSKLSQGSYSITVNNGTEQVIHKFVKL